MDAVIRRRWVLWLMGLLLTGALVATFLLSRSSLSAAHRAKGAEPVAPYPTIVGMKLGKEMRLDMKRRMRHEIALLCDAGGTPWVFSCDAGGSDLICCSKFVNGTPTPLETIAKEGWRSFDSITASLDAAGNPVVIWVGFRTDKEVAAHPLTLGRRNESGTGVFEGAVLAASAWTGEKWSKPAIIDVLGMGTFASSLRSMRDASGAVHVVYDRKLEPPEQYNIGFILGEGFSPRKCFHAYLEGGKWSTAVPTTGEGKYYLSDMRPSLMPEGQVALSVLVRPPHGDGTHVGWQKWDGKKWSGLEQVGPRLGSSTYEGGSLIDRWGTRVTWWEQRGGRGDKEQNHTFAVSSQRKDRPFQLFEGSLSPISAIHTSGAVVMLSPHEVQAGELRAWDGRKWTEPLACPHGLYLAGSPSGKNFYVAGWEGDQLVVQELTLETTESAVK
jgi:hypothetical protein